jgi:predicted glycosyltransferase involved in capsule biosynthesis
MNLVMLVPWRSDGAERATNWAYLRRYWERHGWGGMIFEGDSEGSFSRARALNVAAERAGDWDAGLICDADVYVAASQADRALACALQTGTYTVAHSEIRYLGSEATLRVIEHGRDIRSVVAEETVGETWESCFAIRRDLWDQVGGFDERFHGYGFQGVAFFCAAATLGGRERIEGLAYHLAHPYVDRSAEPHFAANSELADHYLAAVDDPEAMLAVLP